VILFAGIPSEGPMELAIDAAETAGIEHVVFDQREQGMCDLSLDLDLFGGWRARLTAPSGAIDLGSLSGTYVRLMDEQLLPGVRETAGASPERTRSASLHALLHSWLDIAPGRVANRPRAMASNMSKTYQASIIRSHGFPIPETLVTNDPNEALAFVAHCANSGDEVIYKSVSGARSIVQTFSEADRERLHRIRWCPTQFQRRVRGEDIRVHAIGSKAIAVAIRSDATDYRYAERQVGNDAELEAIDISERLAGLCVGLGSALDLPFCGIDLRKTPDGQYVCFEVNPSPAFSYYESRTGAPIAHALVRWLAGYDIR
jgi:hypothetical protein